MVSETVEQNYTASNFDRISQPTVEQMKIMKT
jgi:hypothetical protein